MKNQKSFTLIELFVVIAIIGLISSIVLVVATNVREKAKRTAGLHFASQVHHALGAEAVGIWDFDDQANPTKDSSGYNNNGALTNGPIWRCASTNPDYTPSGKGCSLSFDGADDRVNVGSPVPASLQVTTAITLEAWIKPAANGGSLLYQIVGSQYDTGGYRGATIFIDGRTSPVGKIHFQIGDGSGWHAIENPAGAYIVPLNVWTHVVAVWSSGNQGRVYFNGVLDSAIYQNAWSGSIGYSAGQEFSIGRQKDMSRYFNGFIDDVRIYAQALSSAQIEKLYAEGARERGLLAGE